LLNLVFEFCPVRLVVQQSKSLWWKANILLENVHWKLETGWSTQMP
jgi:hypothetical protein